MTQWTPQPERRTGNLWIGMVLGVIVGLMLVGLIFALTVGRPGTTATPSPAPTATVEPVATPTPPPTLEPTATPTPTATAEPVTTPTPSATPSPTPTPTPTAPPEGIVTDLSDGTYITVLESLRKGAVTPEQAMARASRLGNATYRPVVLDSDEFGNLKPGFWVIAIPGAADGAEAKARCAEVGEAFGTDCYVRQIQD